MKAINEIQIQFLKVKSTSRKIEVIKAVRCILTKLYISICFQIVFSALISMKLMEIKKINAISRSNICQINNNNFAERFVDNN